MNEKFILNIWVIVIDIYKDSLYYVIYKNKIVVGFFMNNILESFRKKYWFIVVLN